MIKKISLMVLCVSQMALANPPAEKDGMIVCQVPQSFNWKNVDNGREINEEDFSCWECAGPCIFASFGMAVHWWQEQQAYDKFK